MVTTPTPNLKQDGREEKAKPRAGERAGRSIRTASSMGVAENDTFGTATPRRSGRAEADHQDKVEFDDDTRNQTRRSLHTDRAPPPCTPL